ncbi:nitrogen fixation protein NifM [Imhoffiella purpurea]|uniref:NifZ family protein n=1 Tax=Imhoffiella purpurea TaxID=1249627 RepID=W9VUB3_9GAMM|nr:nitrogen fixation protein NifM [Imhoffiella purpurea]EXJ13950.1 NifZ family protein [Imhoffiella purpurea]
MTASRPSESSPEYRYHLLRAASERFQSMPSALTGDQLSQAERQANQTLELESLVLTSPEARDTQIPEPRLDEAVAEVRGRFEDGDAFLAALDQNGLDESGLRLALRRELLFDAVMQRVGSKAEAVTEVDARLFYELHQDRFQAPERRTLRHILITINADYAENERAAAMARLERVEAELKTDPARFGQLAQQHSECPTAMQEGQLGTVPRGKLYPELDAVLFGMDEGEVSGIVESEVGLHLLLCERIHAAAKVPFEQARDKIHESLHARRQRECQKRWLAELRQQAPPIEETAPA